MKKLLLIDNYDSFTFNLVQYFQQLGVEVLVYRNDEINLEQAIGLSPDYLVFSPGPGSVEVAADVGVGPEFFHHFRTKIPILGVCLGQQMMGYLFGGKIEKVKPVHGKRWPMKVLDKAGLFQDFDDKFFGMRYHSMVVNRQSVPTELTVTVETDDEDKLVMAFENINQKIFGVQFHPESIGTEVGMKILENFLKFGQ